MTTSKTNPSPAPPGTSAPVPLVEHFFRHEYGRLVSVLTRMFGWRHIDTVEDMVQASLVEALRLWRTSGVPDNPFAWLRRVAKNKVLDVLRREQRHEQLLPELAKRTDLETMQPVEDLLSDSGISDSQLRMIFACCHPDIAPRARLALTLKILCGFHNREISRALLMSEENVKKRLTRAKAELVALGVSLEVPNERELPSRLDSVHQVMYLLFNEGYASSSVENPIRVELCEEAVRLCQLVYEQPTCSSRDTQALLALMLFHAARLPGRMDPNGSLLLLQDQDRQTWDRRLIGEATRLLCESGKGAAISRYHLEAGIAMLHTHAPSFAETNWQAILTHYDMLLQLDNSPICALNRAVVVAELQGATAGLEAIDAIAGLETLRHYHLLDATLGELHRRAGHLTTARQLFESARSKTVSPFERELIDRKLKLCGERTTEERE